MHFNRTEEVPVERSDKAELPSPIGWDELEWENIVGKITAAGLGYRCTYQL